jgi:hypothetical protein
MLREGIIGTLSRGPENAARTASQLGRRVDCSGVPGSGGGPALCSAKAGSGELMDRDKEDSRRNSARDQTTESEAGTVQWIASSTGRGPRPRPRRTDFPRSSRSAWEAAVPRGRQEVRPRAPIGQEAPEALELPAVDDYDADDGVEANARLTGMTAAVLLALLAVEGFTILSIGKLLTLHVVIGMVLVPPVLLKIGSTTWRFARYYLGAPEYRRKGPPPVLLRLLGPFLVVLTLAVLSSGIALLLGPSSARSELSTIHKATFILWIAAMVVHVLGHVVDTARLAPKDFYWRTRRQVRGASRRQWALVGALCLGLLLAVAVAPKVGPWRSVGTPAHLITPAGNVGSSHSAHSAPRL